MVRGPVAGRAGHELPVRVHDGLFYRSGKPLLAPALLALMFTILRVQQTRSQSRADARAANPKHTRDALIVFALATVMGLLDRQGHFYVGIACVLLFVHYRRTRELKDLLLGAVAAAVLVQLYNMVLGPLLIWAVNGYWPSLKYQVPPRRIIALSLDVVRALDLLTENAMVMLGGFAEVAPMVFGGLAAFLGIRAWGRRRKGSALDGSNVNAATSASGAQIAFTYAGIAFALQVAMFTLMIARHPYLYEWIDHRYWYYPLPYLMTLLFGLALMLDALYAGASRAQLYGLRLALLLIALSNLVTLDVHKRLMLSSHWFGPTYGQSELLKAALRGGVPDERLDAEYARFLAFCDRIRGMTR